jgi:ABC-type Fe3+-citrate transport system substrate-binding protein
LPTSFHIRRIFWLDGWDAEIEQDFLASPLWQTLSAVQNDRVFFINGEYWIRDNPIAAHAVLDDLFRIVAGVDPAEVAPNPFLSVEATDTP